jgi:hypothetical protein
MWDMYIYLPGRGVMALTYDLTKVKDWDMKYPNVLTKNHKDEDEYSMNPITNVIIFGTVVTGIRDLTEKTVKEFFTRLRMSELVSGDGYLRNGSGYRSITYQEVLDHVGLHTNANDITKAKFNNKISRQLRDKATRQMKEKVYG